MRKEIPILFSTAMVQAILEDRKTVTRRVVKYGKQIDEPQVGFTTFTPDDHFSVRGVHEGGAYGESFFKMPWRKGDVLWVRESWAVHSWYPEDGEMCIRYMVGDHTQTCYDLPEEIFNRLWEQSVMDLADNDIVPDEHTEQYEDFDVKLLRKRPSIHMPKEAARIWLEVAAVRVERLQDISQEDAKAEGISAQPHRPSSEGCRAHADNSLKRDCYCCAFKFLWNVINGKKAPWDNNPWVWVVEFKVLSTTGKPEGL